MLKSIYERNQKSLAALTQEEKNDLSAFLKENHLSENEVIIYAKNREGFDEFNMQSNYPITIENVTYPTADHYIIKLKLDCINMTYVDDSMKKEIENFKSNLFSEKDPVKKFRDLESKFQSEHKGEFFVKDEWVKVENDFKKSINYRAHKTVLLAKFEQNENLRKLILETGIAPIIVISDCSWGITKKVNRENKGGKLLEEVRQTLKSYKETAEKGFFQQSGLFTSSSTSQSSVSQSSENISSKNKLDS